MISEDNATKRGLKKACAAKMQTVSVCVCVYETKASVL